MGGALLVVAGVWVLCQVLGGNALGRLRVSGAPTEPEQQGQGKRAGKSVSDVVVTPPAMGG